MTDQDKSPEAIAEEVLQNAETKTPHEHVKTNDSQEPTNTEEIAPSKKTNIFRTFGAWYTHKKKIAIPLTVVVLLALGMAVPTTRYGVLGMFVKRDVQVKITDMQTFVPISGVDVSAGGKSAKTDAQGLATLKSVRVGKTKLQASKKYYKDFSADLTVTLKKVTGTGELRLEATGRQVPIHVINKITGASVSGATVKAADTEVQTDKNGFATLVLPPDQATLSGTVSAKDYNDASVKITVSSSAVKENTFSVAPAGTVYFLSKKSGKIDVVKTDLDGGNRQTVLAGTGKEEDTNTVLLASRDWKYLALQSRRDSDKAKLYLIDTSNDKLTEIDSGNATFELVGWHEHNFVYKVNRDSVLVWQSKGAALKTYNAENQQLTVIDETNAEGSGDSDYVAESLDNAYILRDSIIYTKRWYASYYSAYRLSGKRMGIYSVKPNGTNKQLVKDFNVANNGYINAVLYKPDELYFLVSAADTSYYEYDEGTIKETKDVNDSVFYKFYPTYLVSPSGEKIFWYEPRDGKNTLFTGSQDAGNPTEVASLSEYVPYGWYSDDYLLVSKGGSELFILPATGPGDKGQVLKITDYHKPNTNFPGYGYGYGGV